MSEKEKMDQLLRDLADCGVRIEWDFGEGPDQPPGFRLNGLISHLACQGAKYPCPSFIGE